jgi:hypothetical protein
MRTLTLQLFSFLAIGLLGADGIAETPRSLSYDHGISGVLQRLHLKGKTVVTKDRLPDGGERVRRDSYVPWDGQLQLKITQVEGTHANGARFQNTHIYNSEELKAEVIPTLKDLDDALMGGSPLKRVVGVTKMLNTQAQHSESIMQITTLPDGTKRTDIRLGLKDGSIRLGADNSVTVKTERGTQQFPPPGLRPNR